MFCSPPHRLMPRVPTDPALDWQWADSLHTLHSLPPQHLFVCITSILSGSHLSDVHVVCWVIVQRPLLITHRGLCIAHCQATILPLSHLYSTLPPSAKPFATTRDFGDIARRTSRGTPRIMWGCFLLYNSGSK